MDALFPVIVFALVGGGFAWLIVTQTRKQKAREAGVDALAQAQGWRIDRRAEGRRRVTTITPLAGGWVLRLSPSYSTGGKNTRNSVPGFAEFRADLPNWPGGRAIFSQRLPGGVGKLMGGTGLVGFLQNAAVKAMLNRAVGAESLAEIGRLEPFEPPAGIELTILASEDPRDGNLRAIHDAIHGWQPRHSRDRSPPAVTIGPEGTTFRLPAHLDEADDILAFIEKGNALAGELGST